MDVSKRKWLTLAILTNKTVTCLECTMRWSETRVLCNANPHNPHLTWPPPCTHSPGGTTVLLLTSTCMTFISDFTCATTPSTSASAPWTHLEPLVTPAPRGHGLNPRTLQTPVWQPFLATRGHCRDTKAPSETLPYGLPQITSDVNPGCAINKPPGPALGSAGYGHHQGCPALPPSLLAGHLEEELSTHWTDIVLVSMAESGLPHQGCPGASTGASGAQAPYNSGLRPHPGRARGHRPAAGWPLLQSLLLLQQTRVSDLIKSAAGWDRVTHGARRSEPEMPHSWGSLTLSRSCCRIVLLSLSLRSLIMFSSLIFSLVKTVLVGLEQQNEPLTWSARYQHSDRHKNTWQLFLVVPLNMEKKCIIYKVTFTFK